MEPPAIVPVPVADKAAAKKLLRESLKLSMSVKPAGHSNNEIIEIKNDYRYNTVIDHEHMKPLMERFDHFIFDFDNTITFSHSHTFPVKSKHGGIELSKESVDKFMKSDKKDVFMNTLFGSKIRREFIINFINFLITNGKRVSIATFAIPRMVEYLLDILFGRPENPFKLALNNILQGQSSYRKVDIISILTKDDRDKERVIFFDDDHKNIKSLKGYKNDFNSLKGSYLNSISKNTTMPLPPDVDINELKKISAIGLCSELAPKEGIPNYFNNIVIEKIIEYLNSEPVSLPIPDNILYL
jgi:hypothetical protein